MLFYKYYINLNLIIMRAYDNIYIYMKLLTLSFFAVCFNSVIYMRAYENF